MNYRILLADDDNLVLSALKCLLSRENYIVDTASSAEETFEQIKKNGHEYACVVLDYHFGHMKGPEVIKKIREIQPKLYILIHSGDFSRDVLKETWLAGATAFLEKNVGDFSEHLETIKNWCQKYEETQRALNAFQRALEQDFLPELNMIGVSPSMKEIDAKVKRYRQSKQNILILGETGTGKELVARALHQGETENFFAVNCAAFKNNTELLESELFGYEKGAFTGANSDKKGILEACNGGTVFLDEIHHLSLTAQAKLLRVCQDKKIRRVGGTKEIQVNFKLIAAAKPDLESICEQGLFLNDLYHRLNILLIQIPALRERKEDIDPLAAYFCRKHFETTGEKKTLLMRTIRQLKTYSWPGNVRELENTIYRLLTDSNTNVVEPEQLDAKFFSNGEYSSPASFTSLKEKHSQEEKKYIESVLNESKNKMEAANKLQISPSTLHSIMKRLGMYA